MNLSTASLRTLLLLVEKKESLQSELAKIEGEIASCLGGNLVGNGKKSDQKTTVIPAAKTDIKVSKSVKVKKFPKN